MSLELQQVRKSFREPGGGRLPILAIERFSVASGEQVALIGSSGGGKTTLLNVIAGLTTVDSGNVLVGGVNLTRLSEPARDQFRSARIGYVFQTFHLLPAFSALENVLLGMSFGGVRGTRADAKALLDKVGLGHRLNHRPGQLSVGEQQRVSVARALAKRPQLLLADEPTASVDRANQQTILQLLRALSSEHGVTLLLVTHDLSVAEQFPRVERLADFNRPEVAA
jgi:putative ABC transport system ATP-binding protein